MEKKGDSHIEIIISFVLFFIFVGFVLIFIQPVFSSDNLPKSILTGLHDSFLRETKIDVTRVFLVADFPEDFSSECFGVDLGSLNLLGESLARTALEGGMKIDSGFSSSELSLEKVGKSYEVFFSEDFSSEGFSCERGLMGENFEIGSVDNLSFVFEGKLGDLEGRYKNDYENLKRALGVPQNFDFAISSGDFVLERDVPENLEVYAKEYVEVFFSEDGEVKTKKFVFRVW